MNSIQDAKIAAVKTARRYIELDPIFFDTETTGLGPAAEIVNIAIVDSAGAVLLDTLIKPYGAIDPGASAITGIFDETVKNAPTILDVLPKIRSIFSGRVIGAYNADFDFRILHESICRRAAADNVSVPLIDFDAVFDVIRIGAMYYGEYSARFGGWKNKKLKEVAARVGLEFNEADLHGARADAELTARVLRAIAADPIVPVVSAEETREVIDGAVKSIESLTAEILAAGEEIAGLKTDVDAARRAEMSATLRTGELEREITRLKSAAAGKSQAVAVPVRVREIIASNPYMLTRNDWIIIHAFMEAYLK